MDDATQTGLMMKIYFLLLLTLLPITPSLLAQTPGIVTGRITERITGQPIAKARIALENKAEAATDADGRYRIELAPGTYKCKISAPGFAPLSIEIVTVTAKYTAIYDAQLEVQITDEQTVRAGYFTPPADQPVSSLALRRNEIRAVPGSAGDVLRALSVLPGVTSAGAQFADLLVRGGLPGENLTFVNNIPIGDFAYFTDQYDGGKGGRAAVLAPDIFDRLEFSAGGFGVRYGDKLSSVLDVTMRSANRERFQGSAFVDSGGAGTSLEIPLGKRAGWFFSMRRSFIDIAFDLFNIGDIGRPRNLDFINKIDVDVTPSSKLMITAMSFRDNYSAGRETALRRPSVREQLISETASQRYIVGATLSSTIGTKSFSNLTAWGIGEHNDGSFLRLNGTTLQRQRDLREANFGIKEEFTTAFSPRLNLATGGGLIWQQGRQETFYNTGRGISLLLDEYLAPAVRFARQLDLTTNAYGYAQLNWQAKARFSVLPGLRIDRYGLTGETLVSPRVSARMRLASRLALNVATGVYRQPPSTFFLALAPNNLQLKAQRTVHYIGGVEWQFAESARMTVEAYQKNYSNQIVPPTFGDRTLRNNAEGYVRGVEFTVQKVLAGRWSGQANYAYTFARQRFLPNGDDFANEVVRPHQLTLVGGTRWKGWSFASKLRYASGLPYHRRETITLTNPTVTLWTIARDADRNALNFNNYFQLDLRVEKKFDYKRWSLAPFTDIFNLTKHRNITEVSYPNTRTPRLTGERSLIPFVGLRVEF
jgi:hypothetical protein